MRFFVRHTLGLSIALLALGIVVFGGTMWLMANNQVMVTAVVGAANVAPTVPARTPGTSPVSIARNAGKAFSVQVSDLDNDTVTFTVTPDVGAATVTSGTLTNTSNGATFITFDYVAPSTRPSPNTKVITITLNDGHNSPVVYTIPLYIF